MIVASRLSRSSRMRSSSRRAVTGSRPTEGSSKKSISGSREIARAIAEYGYGGGITIVKDYVQRRQRLRKVFVPSRHYIPGHFGDCPSGILPTAWVVDHEQP